MKPLLLAVLFFTSVPVLTQAQTDPSFKQDSTTLAKQLILEKLKGLIATEQKNQATTNKEDTPEKIDPNEQLKTDIERLGLLQKALGPSSISALSGSVTISEGTTSLAETRALAYQALDNLLPTFIKSMTDMGGTCTGLTCPGTATILIYNPTYFEALPDYQALINELTLLKRKYEEQKAKADNPAAASFVAALALGSSVIKSLIDVASLFKADRTIIVNKEIMDEETIVSKIRALDKCCERKYYYPTLFSHTSDASALTGLLADIGDIRTQTDELLVVEKKKINDRYEQAVKEINKPKKPPLKADEKKEKLKDAEKDRKDAEDRRAKIESNVKVLNDRFDGIAKALATPVESTPKMSLLRQLLRVEGVLARINAGAYTLKLTAEGKGTNVITKFLWKTTLRHSAFVEARFQLFDNQGVLLRANAVYQYVALKKSNEILP